MEDVFEGFYSTFVPEEMIKSIFEIVLEITGAGALAINSVGRIIFCDPNLAKMFGYEISECIGKKLELFLPDGLKEIHVNNRETFFRNPSPRRMGEGRKLMGQRKDGTQFEIEIGLNSFHYNDKPYSVAVVRAVGSHG